MGKNSAPTISIPQLSAMRDVTQCCTHAPRVPMINRVVTIRSFKLVSSSGVRWVERCYRYGHLRPQEVFKAILRLLALVDEVSCL